MRAPQSRRPYDLMDITDEATENEVHEIAKLRDLQVHLDQVAGRPQLSLLTKSQKQQSKGLPRNDLTSSGNMRR